MRKPYIFIFLIFAFRLLAAQGFFPKEGYVFNDQIVPRVDVLVDTDSLAAIYNPVNAYSDHEYPATFVFTSGSTHDTIFNIGLRLRGNTSRLAAKKSFKISFNSFIPGRKYHGLQKMHLNGEHNDPSIIRSKLCWDLYRKMDVPAPRANHVQVYINGNYMGLYINVEHIDEQFIDKRFHNKDGNLFKCIWPSDLAYISNNPDDYKNNGGYALKTNRTVNDYSDLAHFIDVLNNTPLSDLACALEPVFNVDVWLRALAVDVFTGNWDGPAFNKNNFYLYHNTQSGRFEYVPYDLDNTLGIDWFGIDWSTRDIYQWSPGTEPRPIYDRILQVPAWKNLFSFYLDSLIHGVIDTTLYFQHIDSIYTLIYPFAAADSYRPLDYGFTINDFTNSYTQALTGHVTAGLKPFITDRILSAMSQLQLNPFPPAFIWSQHQHPGNGQVFPVQCKLAKSQGNDAAVWVIWQEGSLAIDSLQLQDDGLSGDLLSGDGIYGGSIGLNPGYASVQYYFRASNLLGSTSYPCDSNLSILRSALPQISINEILALNNTAWQDQAGEFDDWIELVNYGSQALNSDALYLSDNASRPGKWQMPSGNFAAHSFSFIWADGQGSQGPWHTNFKLSSGGEFIGLYWKLGNDFIPLDSLSYGAQTADISEGRLPDGTGSWQTLSGITPGYSNLLLGMNKLYISEFETKAFPNPFTDQVMLTWYPSLWPMEKILIVDMQGKVLLSQSLSGHKGSVNLPLATLAPGMYLAKIIPIPGNGIKEKVIRLMKF